MAKLTLVDLAGGYLSTASVNSNYALIEAAMENTLSRDGTTPNVMSADIDMNSAGRITNLKDAVGNQEPVTLAQASLLAGVTNALTQDNVAAVLWPQQTIETTNGITATELQFYFGDVRRYGAKLDSSTDDTGSFNDAIQSGYGAFCDQGTANIVGTIVLDGPDSGPNGGKHLRLTGLVTLQRFNGDATTPLIHLYGQRNNLEGNGATIRQNLYEHQDGIVLLGPDPNEATISTTNIATQTNTISGLKIVGPENTAQELETGAPGLYIHSAARKKGIFVGVTTYKNSIWDMQILNCDVGIEFSSDANANSVFHCHFHQWIKAAIYFNGSYGNDLYGIKMESPLQNITPSTDKRFALHFADLNSGVESDTDAGYLIESAWRNSVKGWAELPDTSGSDPNKNVALFTHTETGTFFGLNTMDFPGSTLSGGLGIGGLSDETAMGTNTVITPSVQRMRGRIIDMGGYSIREFDTVQDNGRGYLTKDNWLLITGRVASLAESTSKDIFSIEGIGPNVSAALIKIMWVAKSDSIASAEAGEIMIAVSQSSTGVYVQETISDLKGDMGDAALVTWAATLAVDPNTAGSMLATFKITTGAPAGTNLLFMSWKAEIIVTETEDNADFDGNLKILAPAATT